MSYNIFDVAKDELTGNAVRVPKEVKQYRLSICSTCEHFKRISRQCGICGCFLDWKTVYANSECADNPPRWNAI